MPKNQNNGLIELGAGRAWVRKHRVVFIVWMQTLRPREEGYRRHVPERALESRLSDSSYEAFALSTATRSRGRRS